jgi:acetate kinase
MRVLVLNPGSSSLKAALVEVPGDRVTGSAEADWGSDATSHADRAADVARLAGEVSAADPHPDAVGYRVVHGGERYRSPTLIDDEVLAAIAALAELAPLHNTIAAETIRAGRERFPRPPHIACFDTAFHASLPPESARYALPRAWIERWGLRRYGFHGLSVEWAVARAPELLGRRADELRLVIAHLGSGCSVSAVSGGRSVATSMGFTPLEGMVMGTRAGSVDPGILLHLLRGGLSVSDLGDGLERRSGLLGLSGASASVRDLEAAAAAGDAVAPETLAVFAASAAAWIAAMATSLDRLDALVFTGGVGEHSHSIRAAVCRRLEVVGVPAPAEVAGEHDAVLSLPGQSPAVVRIAAREELTIARGVATVVEG